MNRFERELSRHGLELRRAKLRTLFSHLRGVGLEVPPFAAERRVAAKKGAAV